MDPIVSHVLAGRDLVVPAEDEAPLEEYWRRMRRLRAQVDESRLADHEIAVTWTPVGEAQHA
jgi:hypothetical protein